MKFPQHAPRFLSLWFFSVFCVMLLLALGRLALWIFAAEAGFPPEETARAWSVALRFDMMAAAYLCTPVLLCWGATAAFPRQRRALLKAARIAALCAGVLVVLLEVADFGFFLEYGDQFNVWVLGMANDDARAVLGTILRDYAWERYLLAAAAGTLAWTLFFLPASRRVAKIAAALPRSRGISLAFFFAALACAVVFYRGGAHRRPLRLRDAAVCATEKLNNLVLNPAYALKTALVDRWKISNQGAAPYFVGDVPAQAKLLFGKKAENAQTISELFMTKNERLNPGTPPPKRVFLFVMESYDRWPMLEKYAGLGLCDALRALEKNGASSPNFVSGADGTMLSLSAILSGIPDIEAAQNYRPGGEKAFPTALAEIFGRLGYKTRFAYCGYGFWQHVENYAREQGFDEVVLGGDVPDCPKKYKGEWGVPDHFLFSHLEKLADADGDAPVFTLVLSASYHPPYNLPLEEFGCPPLRVPAELEKIFDGKTPLNTFAHFRYADRALGKFVADVSRKHPDTLFAVTGDHFSRRFPNANPTAAERTQVPFVLAGEGVPAGTALPFGTHADIAPTLLSLCAPEGFEYMTFGVSLFSEKARSRRCAYGARAVVHEGGLFIYGTPQESCGKKIPPEEAEAMKAETDALRALAWTYFEKGDALTSPEKEKK